MGVSAQRAAAAAAAADGQNLPTREGDDGREGGVRPERSRKRAPKDRSGVAVKEEECRWRIATGYGVLDWMMAKSWCRCRLTLTVSPAVLIISNEHISGDAHDGEAGRSGLPSSSAKGPQQMELELQGWQVLPGDTVSPTPPHPPLSLSVSVGLSVF